MTTRDHAVVLGASMAGLLAARTLGDHFGQVTVLERDDLSEEGSRRGVPQGRHIHVLLAKGQEVMESRFPGLTDDLQNQGAPLGDMLGDARVLMNGRRVARTESGLKLLNCARPDLERAVRDRVGALDNVEVLPSSTASGLLASSDRRRVTGVTVASENGENSLEADLVVDATGRASRTPAWLEDLGYGSPPEEKVRVDVGYATRLYRMDRQALGGDNNCLMGRAPAGTRGGALARITEDTWILTLFGYLGDHPERDHEAHLAFTRTLPFDDIHDAVADAEPLDEGASFRFAANTRRRYDRLRDMPDGLVTAGDGVASFNPVYGQGMTVAALQAEALDGCLRRDGDQSRRIRRALTKSTNVAWEQAIGADLALDGAEGRHPAKLRMTAPYVERVMSAATEDPAVATAFARVIGLVDPPQALMRPWVMRRAVRAGRI